MIRTRLAMWAAAAGFAASTLILTSHASADTDLPATITASPNADKGAERTAVQNFVKEQVAKLGDADPAVRAAARDLILSKVSGAGSAAPSAVFLDFYITELGRELAKPLADTKIETRLNTAIVVAKLTSKDESAKLADVTTTVLSDKQDAVVLWGLKAASQLLPRAVMSQPKASPLLAKITEVANARMGSTAIVEAYDALTLTTFSSDPTVLPTKIKDADWQKLVVVVSPELNKLWAARLNAAANGTLAEPAAEQVPAQFYGVRRTWTALQPPEQAKVMQMLSDQLSISAELAATGSSDKPAYMKVLKRTAAAIQVIGDFESNRALSDAMRGVTGLQDNTAGSSITAAVEPVLPAIQSVTKFAGTKAPPKVKGQPG